ncbi:unnamed protein product [Pylaiella littoralis]
MNSKGRHRPLMRRVALTLGLLFPNFDQVSDAFVFHLPTPKQSTAESSCRDHAAVVAAARAFESTSSLEARGGSSSCVAAGRQAAGIGRQRHRRQTRRTVIRPTLMSFEPGVEAGAASAGGGGGAPEQGSEGGLDMAPVDLEQAMGSFSPEWANGTARVDAKEQLIKGSVIAANQTVFPYPIDSFPPLANSEVYYNGTSERYWWNQNSDAVSVYVPVPEGFQADKVEFVAKTKHISLKLDGEEARFFLCCFSFFLDVLSGTLFYRIDGYESLYMLDSDNDPPYVQLELFKVREFQNWEDLLLEKSSFTPGGAQ